MKRVSERLRCLRHEMGVAFALHILTKRDRLFEYYWALMMTSGAIAIAVFAFVFFNSDAQSASPISPWQGALLLIASPLPGLWVLSKKKWVLGCPTIDPHTFNTIIADYGFGQRDFYVIGETYLIKRFLTLQQRVDHEALYLSIHTKQKSASSSPPRRI